MHNQKALFVSLLATLLMAALPVQAADSAGLQTRHEFKIPPQALDTALLAFSDQAKVQVLMWANAQPDARSLGVSGQLTALAALQTILADTGLAFRAIDDETVAIVAPGESAKPAVGAGVASTGAVRLAQADAAPTPAKTEAANNPLEELEEIVVTGSHIRGVAPVGSLIRVERADIERSGYATVQDYIMSLPQNFGGGDSVDFNSDASAINLNRGTAINLRGLGADSTLVLVNGQRQANGGLNGAFMDVSSIPLAAIDRMEILTDGASAIYGSDAVGGVVNFILRKDYQGAESRIRAGTAPGGMNDLQLSQTFGGTWASGGGLLGYQYYERDSLGRSDRSYTASDDLSRFGGDDFRTNASSPGNILDPLTGLAAFAIPSGQDGLNLTPGDLLPGVSNFNEYAADTDLLPQERMHSGFFSASQELSPRLKLTADGRFSRRTADFQSTHSEVFFLFVPPDNPYYVDAFGDGSPLFINFNPGAEFDPEKSQAKTTTRSLALTLDSALSDRWHLTISGADARERVDFSIPNLIDIGAIFAAAASNDIATAFNPFGDASGNSAQLLESMLLVDERRAISHIQSATAKLDGSLFALPAGGIRAAAGADFREEKLTTAVDTRRSVTAAFAELVIPVIGNPEDSAAQRLDLTLAGRHEHYSDFGNTFNPKIGLRWSVTPSFGIRTSWGESFKAPRLGELADEREASPGNRIFAFPLFDPQLPGVTTALVLFGNNEDLKPETAENWTIGFDVASTGTADVQLSMSYYDIDYRDRIAIGGPSDSFSVLSAEEFWQDIIVRDPPPELIAQLCNDPRFNGSPQGCLNTPFGAVVDFRFRNLARSSTRGFDGFLHYGVPTALGKLSFDLNANYVLDFERQVSSTSPTADFVDTVSNPPRLRLRTTAGWQREAANAALTFNYTGSYRDPISVPERTVDSALLVDLSAGYNLDRLGGLATGMAIDLTVVNVFDEEPPFANLSTFGYDAANFELLGRVASLAIRKSW